MKHIKLETNMVHDDTKNAAAKAEVFHNTVDGNASTENVAQWEEKSVSSEKLRAPVKPLHLHNAGGMTHVYSDTQRQQIAKKGSNNAK